MPKENAPADKTGTFAYHYVQTGGNGVQAARLSGHTGNARSLAVTASRLLRTPKVQEALAEIRTTLCMDSRESFQRMSVIARGSMEDFLNQDGCMDLRKARRWGRLGLIKKFRQKKWVEGRGAQSRTVTEISVELYDAQAALRTILQLHGLLHVTPDIPKDPRDLDQCLHDELIRVRGREKGEELSKALGLKVTPGRVH
jgi:hypothetical protein